MKLKARSRLTSLSTLPQIEATRLPNRQLLEFPKPDWQFQTSPQWWIDRRPKLVSLVIGLSIYGYLLYLLTHVFPDQLRDWIIPEGFLPILGLAGLGHLYVWSFITVNPRLAFLISLGLSWLLWLQLHHFVMNWSVIGLSFGVLAFVEIVCLLHQKKHRTWKNL